MRCKHVSFGEAVVLDNSAVSVQCSDCGEALQVVAATRFKPDSVVNALLFIIQEQAEQIRQLLNDMEVSSG